MLQFKDPKKELPKFHELVLVKYSTIDGVFYEMCYLETNTPISRDEWIKKPCFYCWFGEAREHYNIEEIDGWIYTKDLEEIPIE